VECPAPRNSASPRRHRLSVRKLVCAGLALGLIASGRVRRAKRRAFTANTISAIYFHKPAKELFARSIRWLRNNGYTFVSAGDVVRMLSGGKPVPPGAVWLSFDDGCRELLDNVLPLVREFKIPVTLFIPSGIVEGDGLLPWLHGLPYAGSIPSHAPRYSAAAPGNFRDTLTVEELRQIAAYPEVTIGSHTVHHAVTALSTDEELELELGDSKGTIEFWTGKSVDCFAYPEGRFDGREKRLFRAFGYRMAATIESAFVTPATDPYLVPRFSMADDMSFPEAICNMVGVWRGMMDRLKSLLRR
jgi:peptidoglycan/xylan/chitin deacetylase (PgdA/CDA1 family)